jgi:hypothetical protein
MFAQSHDPPAFLQKSGEVYEKIIQIARETCIMLGFLVESGIAEGISNCRSSMCIS